MTKLSDVQSKQFILLVRPFGVLHVHTGMRTRRSGRVFPSAQLQNKAVTSESDDL
jgi:hypothetical protein